MNGLRETSGFHPGVKKYSPGRPAPGKKSQGKPSASSGFWAYGSVENSRGERKEQDGKFTPGSKLKRKHFGGWGDLGGFGEPQRKDLSMLKRDCGDG